ncbi:hypothetical protein LLG07_02475, partial [bacterium]|nr:hypothetical protein [bacterium]
TLNEFIKVYEKSHKALADDLVLTIEKNTTEHKNIVELIQSKISIKAFSAWLTGASVFIGIIVTLLKIFKVM